MQFVVEECVQAGEEIIIVATPGGKPIYTDYFNNSVNRIRKLPGNSGKEDRYEPVQHVLVSKDRCHRTRTSFPYGSSSGRIGTKFVEGEETFWFCILMTLCLVVMGI
jgi:UTP-glucose-1-phosphate uridylyltransferase